MGEPHVSRFWGAVVRSSKVYMLDPDDGSVTVTFAALGSRAGSTDRVVLRVQYDDDGDVQILGVLRRHTAGVKIDCLCNPGMTATFSVEGKVDEVSHLMSLLL